MLELTRECESLQAIDRLRLLRPKETARRVFILCSLPLDINVDHLWSWKELQRGLKVLDDTGGILPLNPKHLGAHCSITERAAKDRISELKRTLSLISIIRSSVLFTANYSTASARRSSEVLYSNDHSIEDVEKVLTEVCGEAIVIKASE